MTTCAACCSNRIGRIWNCWRASNWAGDCKARPIRPTSCRRRFSKHTAICRRFAGPRRRNSRVGCGAALARNIANALRHFYGTQARDPRLEKELADDLDRSSQAIATMVAAPISTPSRQAARREDAVRLAEALQSLSPDYRTVLILRYIDGLTFPLVADAMNRSVDSVEKLWVRAVGQLRRTMGTDS